MASENNNAATSTNTASTPSKLRFLDLLFIVYYTVTFVIALLNFIGITHYNETYFHTTWFVFPYFIQLLATRLITIKEIVFTKFPLEFKSLLRTVLVIQLIIHNAVFYILLKYPTVGEQIKSAKTQLLICNILILLWSIMAIYQKFSKKKDKKGSDKK